MPRCPSWTRAGDLTKNSAGQLLANRVRVDDLVINGGTLKMTPSGGNEVGLGTKNSHVSSLSMTSGTQIDLTNNKMVTTNTAESIQECWQ